MVARAPRIARCHSASVLLIGRGLLATILLQAAHAQCLEVSGLAQLSAVQADEKSSFINSGTGVLRYDDSGVQIQQALLRLDHDLSSSMSLDAVINYYPDGDLHAGVTQAQLKWKPLSDRPVRFRARLGAFYPRMSAENVDIGWLSPYTYTPSAINSWLGEELRTVGVEGSVYSPGRARLSPWSWELTGAMYGANDPLGSVISWRGFAMHDRQSLHHDRLQFAPYPSVIDRNLIWGPAWVEPFQEIDNRIGAYGGFHLRHRNTFDARVYHYNNNADASELNSLRLYAWDTSFTSLALRLDLSNKLRLLTQWMHGDSEMGPDIVGIDFDTYYLMLTYKLGDTRISARYDRWDVNETDDFAIDANDSDGHAWTLAVRHDLDDRFQVGIEYLHNDNTAVNRASLNEPTGAVQQQVLAVIQYRFN